MIGLSDPWVIRHSPALLERLVLLLLVVPLLLSDTSLLRRDSSALLVAMCAAAFEKRASPNTVIARDCLISVRLPLISG